VNKNQKKQEKKKKRPARQKSGKGGREIDKKTRRIKKEVILASSKTKGNSCGAREKKKLERGMPSGQSNSQGHIVF